MSSRQQGQVHKPPSSNPFAQGQIQQQIQAQSVFGASQQSLQHHQQIMTTQINPFAQQQQQQNQIQRPGLNPFAQQQLATAPTPSSWQNSQQFSDPRKQQTAPVWNQKQMTLPSSTPCMFFSKGTCRDGNACRFSHIPSEVSTNNANEPNQNRTTFNTPWQNKASLMQATEQPSQTHLQRVQVLNEIPKETQETMRARENNISNVVKSLVSPKVLLLADEEEQPSVVTATTKTQILEELDNISLTGPIGMLPDVPPNVHRWYEHKYDFDVASIPVEAPTASS